MDQVRVDVMRGGQVESVHFVSAVAVDEAGAVVQRFGDETSQVFWRSAAKPLQALPVIYSGAADALGLTDLELALCCASHSGGPEHLQGAASILRKAGATVDDLRCGPHPPLGEEEARLHQASMEPLTRLHNNCSGKHAGMLGVCRVKGWPLIGYERLDHPLQRELLQVMSDCTAVPVADIGTAVDGCGVVVYRTPLVAMARAFCQFIHGRLPAPYTAAGARLLSAIRSAPIMMAGPGRLCTSLLQVTGGRVLAKIGAEGIYGVGVAGQGGLALKVMDGGTRAAVPAACLLLGRMGWLNAEELAALAPLWQPVLRNFHGDPVGDIRVRL